MHPATRYAALLARDVQKNLFTTVTGLQQVARVSSSARLGGRWTCQDCRTKGSKDTVSHSSVRWLSQQHVTARSFSTSVRLREDSKKDDKKDDKTESATIHLQPPPLSVEERIRAQQPKPAPPPPPPVPEPESIPQPPPKPTPAGPSPAQDAAPTPAQSASSPEPKQLPVDESPSTPASHDPSLPSAFARRRGELSRQFSVMMDNFLTKATLASQQINTYTGTDFSGIEALRTEIVSQEKQVKVGHAAVTSQKDKHMEAHVKQASSQKEIVSLLERKSSWSPSDLERYMTLVRSEHLDEQAVQKAKEDLANAERDLEDSRAKLEKLERKQYHEEQIWSDTIRRNSTWVTIGLMGVNIFLLLAQIVFFEPYRRKKIVREMKEALDERTVAVPGPAQMVATPEAVKEVEPVAKKAEDVPVEAVEAEAETVTEPLVEQPVEQPAEIIIPAEPPTEAVDPAPITADETVLTGSDIAPEPARVSFWEQLETATTWEQRFELSKAAFYDLFSDRLVHLKKVDVTTVALQGAATGVATMGILFLLLRPQSM